MYKRATPKDQGAADSLNTEESIVNYYISGNLRIMIGEFPNAIRHDILRQHDRDYHSDSLLY